MQRLLPHVMFHGSILCRKKIFELDRLGLAGAPGGGCQTSCKLSEFLHIGKGYVSQCE